MNRAQRRQATKEFQAQLASGAVDLAQVSATPKRVYLGYTTGPFLATAWHRSILATAQRSQEFGFVVRPRDCEADGPAQVCRAKNLLVKSFLDTEDEYLLFTETHIAFAPQDVAMLLAADTAIAGALYFSAASGQQSQPQAWVEGDDEAYAPVPLPKPPEDFDETNQEQLEAWMAELSLPIPVAGVGFGLALLERRIVEAVAEHFEYPFEVLEERNEDLNFCLRAAPFLDRGQVVVMPAARVGRIQMVMS